MSDLISRQAAIDAINELTYPSSLMDVKRVIQALPSAQPVSKELIARIREWINSGNRGTADYFIVDRIEEIINEYERLNKQTGCDRCDFGFD